MERLHKVMAQSGAASRRRSEELILRGQVRVDGKVVRELGLKVDPRINKIEVLGKVINPLSPRRYVLLYKPTGYLTTVTDPFKRPTVMQLVGGMDSGLFPVGRLDQNTTGLLLLTNDGDLAFRLTHPKHKIAKVYEAEVKGRPTPDAIWKLRNGLILEDGPTQPARVRITARHETTTTLEITIFEGRKRQVRRMCQAIRYPAVKLKRLAVGPLSLGKLSAGQSRPLTQSEEALLKEAAGG